MKTEGSCKFCKGLCIPFIVSNKLWDKVTKLNRLGGVVCIKCFEKMAYKNGVKLGNWTVCERGMKK